MCDNNNAVIQCNAFDMYIFVLYQYLNPYLYLYIMVYILVKRNQPETFIELRLAQGSTPGEAAGS